MYPLLAAKHFGWHMLATEIDTDSAFIASTNVRKNKLQSMITGMTWYGFYIYFHQNVHFVITGLGNTCFLFTNN